MQLTTRFEEALVYATQLHSQQKRKITGVPYISHLLSVAALVLEDGGSEDEAIAALLHDAIEDQGGVATGEAIRQKFGDQVADIVEGCSESNIEPKPPWQERKQKYIQQLRRCSPEVLRIALADKLHNARCNLSEWYRYGDKAWSQQQRQRTLWLYRSVIEIAKSARVSSFLVRELEQVTLLLSSIKS